MRETWTKIASIQRSGKHMSGEFNKPGNLLNTEVKDGWNISGISDWMSAITVFHNEKYDSGDSHALDGLVNYRKIPTSGL